SFAVLIGHKRGSMTCTFDLSSLLLSGSLLHFLLSFSEYILFCQWFLRDLTGMLGGILFAFYQGSNLDSNAKMWRLVADFMNDLGMLMDLLSPLFPSSLIIIMCLGSLSRSFTGVASGATRAALTQHFALANNAADISAKVPLNDLNILSV
uniref:Protein root UVB sensitive/RUS domain-containing protein n=2 Tax=Aegilops tauschii subsp. strangulata TaxID=200361 RepID=A0A453IN90_AEGTS